MDICLVVLMCMCAYALGRIDGGRLGKGDAYREVVNEMEQMMRELGTDMNETTSRIITEKEEG